ncbi:hypothetical protein [Rufibacter quisquiliarum]|uniref:Uncharacterized protein n=1 Tax=Rufibacter quisquiliarum TaxID=1549639 RepID=A0A839GKK4_9BACT|nr:hypothetical protein [Rufibacter quisquiliarum]MBA9078313.1 hypothetical protein [Rufibacter quisquiliarum]
MAKKNEVTLKNTESGEEKVFGIDHAENLLRYQEQKKYNHWQLTDKRFIFENGDLIRPRGNRPPKGTKE